MKSGIYVLAIFCCGCSSVTVPDNYKYNEIQTSYFKIATWEKITDYSQPLKIYIEGDGYAFNASGRVSRNPTPHGTLMRELAFSDKNANVVYMARPCQYVIDAKCVPDYWSTARFSPEAVQSQYEAIKHIIKGYPVTLIGFSGGAQIAGLVAVKYSDIHVAKLVTIAGNLDVKGWTDYHRLAPLDKSDYLRNYREQYLAFKQKHYVGENDDNIVPQITENFINNPSLIVKVKGASHNRGWKNAFSLLHSE